MYATNKHWVSKSQMARRDLMNDGGEIAETFALCTPLLSVMWVSLVSSVSDSWSSGMVLGPLAYKLQNRVHGLTLCTR